MAADTVELEVGGQTRRLIRLDDTTERLKLKIRSYLDADGVMWRQEVPGVMNLVLEKVDEAEAVQVGQPLSLTNQVTVDKHLGDPQGVTSLTLRVTLDRPADEPPLPTTGRQTLTELSDVEYKLSVRAATVPKRSVTTPVALTGELAELAQATAIAQADDPRMRETAARITAGSTTAWDAARAIVRWVHQNMRKVSSEPRPITALECLENMVGDCTEHALLAGTLARAVGLPSKMCVGLGYTGDAFYYHAWVKIWVGEWAEMDPTWGEEAV
ncbi:MAG: transglutaminase-like domain-containing protein, partial [Dehalococcoidia bacterium]|nr:transglutaminase-like domain-containing protein [Dehalococcoidia bacterium]